MSNFAAIFAAAALLSIPLASAELATPVGVTPSGPYCVWYWYSIGDYTIYLPYATIYIMKIAQGSGQQCVCDPYGGPCKYLEELTSVNPNEIIVLA